MSRNPNAEISAPVSQLLADLDSREAIEAFIDAFYARVLADQELAPLFLEVAGVDLAVHLPHIRDYWCKLLLGEKAYQRHTMNIHRALHGKAALQPAQFERWLMHFHATLEGGYRGPLTDRAGRIADSIAANMQTALSVSA